MVLVDTAVWIRFLAKKSPYVREMERLLALEQVMGHELVYGELLIGDREGRRTLLATYGQMYQARSIPHHHVVEFVESRGLRERGVGWIDIHLLASSVVARVPLWTVDQRLAAVANELGVSYKW
jgi:predicted nucleic acid-binding protein